jgi:hypothetical protein
LAEVLVARDLAFFIQYAVAVVKIKARPESAIIDKLHNGIQVVETVF